MHNRWIQCQKWELAFKKVLGESWLDLAPRMEEWYDKGTSEDKHPITRLPILESYIETVTTAKTLTHGARWQHLST